MTPARSHYPPYQPPRPRSARHPLVWGIGGLVLGIVLTLAAQVLAAPRTSPVTTTSPGGDISISIDDTFVAQQAARGMAQAQLPFTISGVQAHINPGDTISISGTASTGPLSQQFAGTSQVWVAGGQLQSHLTSAEVGSAQLPALVTAALDDAIDSQLDGTIAKLLPSSTGLSLSGLNTSDGTLTLYIAQH
jgi:hypothetical protein